MSHPTTLGLTDAVPDDRLPAGLARTLAAVILVLIGLFGAILLWRWLLGALGQPLPTVTLAALGVLLSGTALIVRWLWWWDVGNVAVRRLDRLVPCCCVTVLLLPIAVVVSLQEGTSPIGLVLFWSALVLEEGAGWLWIMRRGRREAQITGRLDRKPWRVDQTESPAAHAGLNRPPAVEVPAAVRSPTGDPAATASLREATPHEQVTQQFVRSHSSEGADVFSGWLRVEMPTGARTTNVHVAFCPPFARTPTIEVQQVEGPPGRIKTVQALPYGARLDLKLSQPSEEVAAVLLRFVATLVEG